MYDDARYDLPIRLRSELEKQECQHKEFHAQLQNRHASELAQLTEQLLEAENMRTTYEKEVRRRCQPFPFDSRRTNHTRTFHCT